MIFRLVCVYCIIFSSLFVSEIWTSRIYGSFKDARYPGNCVIDAETILPEMASMKDPFVQCGLIICGKNSIVELKSCPLQTVPPNCKLAHLLDPSLQYPQCCEREIECWNYNHIL
ncbi:uncharacterized protein LOC119613590 [Lucilia sericata]|uniref:uncharacterized protein LOC119613590 n=1 Tax=Lucilia sericata TaxID=13632 RepID=UPI0018A80D24|nr:uncharacterized protein LOC119613590 [Lucilia sericata]